MSWIEGPSFTNYARNFDEVFAYGSSGVDQAYLYGSDLNDTFFFKPYASWMTSSTNGYFARGFDEVYGYGGQGDNHAHFYDSAGDDLFIGQATTGSLRGAEYYVRARDVTSMVVRSNTGGIDEALFYDHLGNEALIVQPGATRFITGPAVHRALGFESITAYSYLGGSDVAVLYGSTDAERLEAGKDWVVLSNTAGLAKVRVGGFAAVRAHSSTPLAGSQSQDHALLGDHRSSALRLVGDWTQQPRSDGDMPLLLHPEASIAELYGYAPDFTLQEPAFDQFNRPYIRSRTADLDETSFIHTLRDGSWIALDFLAAIREAYPTFQETVLAAGWVDSRIVFDADDRLYTVLTIRLDSGEEKNVLITSADYGVSFEVHELPPGRYRYEHWVGHNEIDGPPFLGFFQELASHSAFAAYYRLSVVQPRYENGTLVIPEPIVVSDSANLSSQHSGGSSFAVTRDGKTHFIWAETTADDEGGSPIYIAVYDHQTHSVAAQHLLGLVAPANDSHNTPAIALDSGGYLHVIAGVEEFQYFRSLAANDAGSGWTAPETVLSSGWRTDTTDIDGLGRQTYPSFLIDQDNTAHLVFRQWKRSVDQHNQGWHYAALSYQHKAEGHPWSAAQPLVIAARPDYSIYYQKLALDRTGRLFLSLSHYSRWDIDHPDLRPDRYYERMILTSADGGATWRLADTAQFQ